MSKMKGFLALFISLILIIATFGGVSAADTQTSGTGIDLVIVLDNTSSMKENDPNNYRYDAAAMLIQMMDENSSSRVAVLSFNSNPTVEYELTSVQKKEDICNKIYNIKSTNGVNLYRSNVGTALLMAMKILQDRSDTSNQPMIILLSDGEVDMRVDRSTGKELLVKPYLYWDKDTGTIQADQKGKRMGTPDAKTLMKNDVYEAARNIQIPIYTISLNKDPSIAQEGSVSLRNITTANGLLQDDCSIKVDNTPQLFPQFFAKMLATQIGSNVEMSSSPELISDEPVDGLYYYTVNIPILNQSIKEANVILPVDQISAETIQVYYADHLVPFGSDVSLYHNDKGHYAMVKIRNNNGSNSIGMWTLKFGSRQKLDSANAVYFNILYNYNITLNVDLQNSSVIHKKDILTISAYFVDNTGDNAGRPSQDADLYADQNGQYGEDFAAWMNIEAKWKLYKISEGNAVGVQIAEGALARDTLKFTGTIDLSQYNLKGGNYRLEVTAEGAGLSQSVQKNFEIQNQPPELVPNVDSTIKIQVNNPAISSSYQSQSHSIKYSDLFTDADGDPITCSIQATSGDDSVITLVCDDASQQITYTTVPQTDSAGQKYGTATYRIKCSDDDDGSETKDLTIEVHSVESQNLNGYSLYLSSDGTKNGNDSDTYQKNTDITLILQVKNSNGDYISSDDLANYSKEITVTSENGETLATEENFSPDANYPNSLVCKLPAGNHSDTWEFKVVSFGITNPFNENLKVYIPNNNSPVSSTTTSYSVYVGAENIPAWLKWIPGLGSNTPENDPELQITDGNQIFTDGDNDTITMQQPVVANADKDKISCNSDGNSGWKFSAIGKTNPFSYSYTANVSITGKDGGDPVYSANYTRTFVVTDLANRLWFTLIIIGLSILALIILILIIHQIRKPKFPRVALTVREEPSLFPTGEPRKLGPIKSSLNLLQCGVEREIAANHNISDKQLQNIILTPRRSSSSVLVTVKNVDQGIEILMSGSPLKSGAKKTWNVDSELVIQNPEDSGAIAIKLQSVEDETRDNGLNEFGDDFIEADSSMPVSVKRNSRNVKRKSKRKDAPVNESQPANDEFDF